MAKVIPKFLPGAPAWEEQHAAALREFLAGPIGQLFLRSLIYTRPGVTAKNRDERMTQSDERAGYEACIADIIQLADPTTPSVDDRNAQSRT